MEVRITHLLATVLQIFAPKGLERRYFFECNVIIRLFHLNCAVPSPKCHIKAIP